jgi:hypothetical protein
MMANTMMKRKLLCLMTVGLLLQANLIHAQAAQLVNAPSKTTSRTPVASGPSVLGVFDGRFPCAEIAKDWKITVGSACEKVKWDLTLYQDPNTRQPTTYKLRGTLNRTAAREGKWAVLRGTQADPQAVVYQLDADKPSVSIYLLKGDDNVLFILDQERNLRVGNANLSYTLNRVVN